MNFEILSKEVQKFIKDNLTADVHKILLKKSPFPNVTSKELVEQIESKIKSQQKLPTWFTTANIYYPNKRNLSQTSSEITAHYKATLIHGDTLVDITAGLGIDSFAFSKKMKRVVHVEKNEGLSAIAQYNFNQIGVTNVQFKSADGISYLHNTTQSFDWIYVDPSRRDRENKKVYYLADCEPDVTKNLEFLFSKSQSILIKTGPLLDLRVGMNQFTNVKEIHIVAVNNDVKEILWILERDWVLEPLIKTINFKKNTPQLFQFKMTEESSAISRYSKPEKYLYEPNAALLKSGAFQLIGKQFKVSKLHPNSHLYTSTSLIPFPGRIFKIEHVVDYSKKSMKKMDIHQANITTRNFPDPVDKIRKKLKLKEGGEIYLFCTTDINQNLALIICHQIFDS